MTLKKPQTNPNPTVGFSLRPKIARFRPKRSSGVGAARGAAGLRPLHPFRQRRLRAPARPGGRHRAAAPRRLRDGGAQNGAKKPRIG